MKKHDYSIFLSIVTAFLFLTIPFSQTNVVAATEFPIATTTDHEFGVSAAFDGTNYLVGIESSVGYCSGPSYLDCQSKVTAQLISATGAQVGSRINTGRTGGVPYIAFDGTNYLMVWEDDASNDHIYGQLVSKSGQPIDSPFPINQAAGWQTNHGFRSVLFDGANYFVVWDAAPSKNGCADEYGQFVTTTGTLLGSPIKINTTPCGGGGVTAAFDGTNILTAWGSEWNATGTQSVCWTDSSGSHCDIANIWGQLITKSSAGSPGTLSGSNFHISGASVLYNPPALVFDGAKYLAGFAQETTRPDACPTSGCKWDLYGQFVTKAGVPQGSKIPISTTASDHQWASIIWNGTNYLVTWTEGFGTTTTTVKGSYFDTSGSPVGSEFTLFSPTDDGRTPWLAMPMWNGTNYFTIVNRGTPGTADPTDINVYTSQDAYGIITSNTSATTSISLAQGWNFISFPKLPSTSTIETVFTDVSSNIRIVWSYDNATKVWKQYKPNALNNTLLVITGVNGYWLYMNKAGTINIADWLASPSTIALYTGWNLVGFNGTDGSLSLPTNYIVIWTWENGTWKAKKASDVTATINAPELTTLEKGKAYWIKMNTVEPVDWVQ